jgi:DNA polymerase-3 subunit beta
MKFVCEKSAIAREISFAQEIIASKNALSVTSNVLLTAKDGALTIKATDIKVSFETTIPVDCTESGEVTVFCDKLSAILSSIPEGEVSFEQEDSKITIKPTFKKVRFQVKTISSEKYPEIPTAQDTQYFSLSAKEFTHMIEQTIFAVSDDETRYFMNGVYLENTDKGIVFVATDGRRLSYARMAVDSAIPDFKGAIIPPKVLTVLLRHVPSEGLIDVAVTDKCVFFKFGTYKLSSVLIEGQFPNYQKVIPESQQNSLKVSKADLAEALRRVSVFVEQKSRRTFFELSQGHLVIASEESELGTAREELECEYEGPEVTIALNYRYIDDPLKVMDTDDVCIEFTEPNRAITLSPMPRSTYFHVVMPMQLE